MISPKKLSPIHLVRTFRIAVAIIKIRDVMQGKPLASAATLREASKLPSWQFDRAFFVMRRLNYVIRRPQQDGPARYQWVGNPKKGI